MSYPGRRARVDVGNPLVRLENLAGFSLNDNRPSREVPTDDGAVARVSEGRGQIGAAATVESTAVNWAALAYQAGKSLPVRVSPEGDSTALPRVSFGSIPAIRIRGAARGAVTIAATFTGDGEPEREVWP